MTNKFLFNSHPDFIFYATTDLNVSENSLRNLKSVSGDVFGHTDSNERFEKNTVFAFCPKIDFFPKNRYRVLGQK